MHDHALFSSIMTIYCYVDGDYESQYTAGVGSEAFTCTKYGHSFFLSYEAYTPAKTAYCREPCSDHDDESDTSQIRVGVGQGYRLPSEEDAAAKTPEPDAFKAFINKIREFLPWLK